MVDIYSDEPPTEPGWWWARLRVNSDGEDKVVEVWEHPGKVLVAARNRAPDDYLWGPAIPSAARLVAMEAALAGAVEALATGCYYCQRDKVHLEVECQLSGEAIIALSAIRALEEAPDERP